MFTALRRFLSQFLNRSRTINNQPLNKVSLTVIILIDLFILINVFSGLDQISQWHLSPDQVYPCYEEWKSYQGQSPLNRDYELIRRVLSDKIDRQSSFLQGYQQQQEGHLGQVSPICLSYADYQDKVNTINNQNQLTIINKKQQEIRTLEEFNNTIRSQYDSTLLEKLAGQDPKKSINQVNAEKAKQKLNQNTIKITTLHQEINRLKQELLTKSESLNLLKFVNNNSQFASLEKSYQSALFWYPSIQITFQALFLVPLILFTFFVYHLAQKKGYGLVSLMSWHLLVIFFIPLILKLFEFLQIGAIFQFISKIIQAIFGKLLFLVSYVYILLIPLIGFGIIKFCQTIVFNPKSQIFNRFQRSCCVQCARRIRPQDTYCSFCGEYQYIECPNCHGLTYKHLPYCKQCGHPQG